VIAFLCSGQGSQYPGMTRGLMATEPIFRQAMEECDASLRPHLNQSLLTILFDETHNAPQSPNLPISQSPIHQTRHTQPALFAVEYALARLWQAWGVQPDYLLGTASASMRRPVWRAFSAWRTRCAWWRRGGG
jgi:acyl transferase domain-containing protein